MSEAIGDNLKRAASLVGGRVWGIDKSMPRIYMPSRRDAKVYFSFPDAVYTSPADVVDGVKNLGSAALHVYIDDCRQHPNWYRGQRAKMMESQRQAALALDAFGAGDEALAEACMEAVPIEDDAIYDEIAGHIANGRFAEASALLETA